MPTIDRGSESSGVSDRTFGLSHSNDVDDSRTDSVKEDDVVLLGIHYEREQQKPMLNGNVKEGRTETEKGFYLSKRGE